MSPADAAALLLSAGWVRVNDAENIWRDPLSQRNVVTSGMVCVYERAVAIQTERDAAWLAQAKRLLPALLARFDVLLATGPRDLVGTLTATPKEPR